jgi:hypothetical protein
MIITQTETNEDVKITLHGLDLEFSSQLLAEMICPFEMTPKGIFFRISPVSRTLIRL